VRWLMGQSRTPDEIVIGTKSQASDLEQDGSLSSARVRIVRQEGDTRSERIAELARLCSTPWVFPASNQPADPRLIESLILPAPYVGADLVGISSDEGRFTPYSGNVDVNAAVAKGRLVAMRGWPDDAETIHRWSLEGCSVFGIDPPSSK
jgi:hypothetical protein